MTTLRDKLANFEPKSISELDEKFLDLAESFLYGGYISVTYNNKEQYRIYLRTVEFYCHYEGKEASMPKDPIVYHRNGRYVEGEVPYFPLMAFHAHASGFDITFENERLQIRSSALIRAYEVYDVKHKGFLSHDKERFALIGLENKKARVNTQSTYLYDFLNGFVGDSVKWIDDARQKDRDFKIGPRKNVFEYNGEEKTDRKDIRQWSFTRQEEIPEDVLPRK